MRAALGFAAFGMGEQPLGCHEQAHEVCRVVADARGKEPLVVLRKGKLVRVIEHHIGMGGEGEKRGRVRVPKKTGDVLRPVYLHVIRAVVTEPGCHEGRPAVFVVRWCRNAGKRTQELELFLVALERIVMHKVPQRVVHRGLLTPSQTVGRWVLYARSPRYEA